MNVVQDSFKSPLRLLKQVILGLFMAGFSALSLAGGEVNTTYFGNKAIEGYDPVAYFKEKKPVEGKDAYSHEWNDAKWLFSSAENLKLFKENPEKYAPQYGGYCAYAVAKGKTAGIDPDQWTIVDGKLYLNYSASVNKKWLGKRDQFIIDADKNWPELK
jgi:YHS domain-containing protein